MVANWHSWSIEKDETGWLSQGGRAWGRWRSSVPSPRAPGRCSNGQQDARASAVQRERRIEARLQEAREGAGVLGQGQRADLPALVCVQCSHETAWAAKAAAGGSMSPCLLKYSAAGGAQPAEQLHRATEGLSTGNTQSFKEGTCKYHGVAHQGHILSKKRCRV